MRNGFYPKLYAKECKDKGCFYDTVKAQKAVDFIECLKHTDGEYYGKPFILFDWQKIIVKKIFGTVDAKGFRVIRTAYVEIPKKNGKSELAAAVALYLLFADKEQSAQIYGAADDVEQAKIVFDVAAKMVEQSPALLKRCKVLHSIKRIVVHETNSFYKVLSRKVAGKHGFNIHGVIFDELHAQSTRDLWDVLTKGAGDARRQPLFFAITTAGYDRNSICWLQHLRAKKIKDGIIDDIHFLPVIYAVDEDDDWGDEKNWYASNPSLDKTITIERMREAYNVAKESPDEENSFRRLRLNQWVKQETRYIPMARWDQCAGVIDEGKLSGRICCAGLDLSSESDLSALGLVFIPEKDGDLYDLLVRFWIPEDNMRKRSRKDGVPYEEWVANGYVMATPGDVIDYKYILDTISKDMESFDFRELAYDRWGATKLMQDLQEMGFEDEDSKWATRKLIKFGQGFASMSSPTRELLNLTLARRINHGGNPVLRWMADNVVVKKDPADNVKPDKSKSTEKIDGIVAVIMGLDRALRIGSEDVPDAGVEVW